MKRKVLVFICFLLQSVTLFAQGNASPLNNSIRSSGILDMLDRNAELQKRLIEEIILERNLPRNYITENGDFVEIVGVNGKRDPIYYTTFNQSAAFLANILPLQNNASALDLRGQGMVVGVFDATVVNNYHQEFLGNTKLKIMSEPYSKDASFSEKRKSQIAQQHTTHVGGTLIAKGIDQKAQGLIPLATLLSYDWKRDVRDMYYAAISDMLVSNHSYGISVINIDGSLAINPNLVGAYEGKSADYDYVTDEINIFQPVVSVGNYQEYAKLFHPNGKGFSNLVGLANSKNAVAVGAVMDNSSANNIESLKIANFSSAGPTSDFRLKPDVVAKGRVYSPINDFLRNEDYDLKTDLYSVKSGTSMASPVVTSVLTMWQQWAKVNFGGALWSSSLRALLVQSALVNEEMKSYNFKTNKNYLYGPNVFYGWGLVDAKKGVELLEQTLDGRTYLIEGLIENKQAKKYIFHNGHNENSLAITLAWTDPPGEYDYNKIYEGIVSKALVNDLDIRIKVGGNVYLPFAINKDMNNPIAIINDNDVDNMERIIIENLPKGDVEVMISHKGDLLNNKQDFTLLLSTQKSLGLKYIDNGKEDVFKKPLDKLSMSSKDEIIKFWPNPATNNVNILYDPMLQIYDIKIFNYSGQQIKSFRDFSEITLDVSELDTGLYIIKANTSEGTSEFKLIKK